MATLLRFLVGKQTNKQTKKLKKAKQIKIENPKLDVANFLEILQQTGATRACFY